jgi:predicted nuclease of restriction endonuclease-like (RecB) superfamily
MFDDERQSPATPDTAGVAAEFLFKRVAEIIDGARGRLAQAVNSAMVQAYWAIGREIVLVEQRGDERAEYGESVVRRLSIRLSESYGRGYSLASIWRMRQFYLAYPAGSALSSDPPAKEILAAARRESGPDRLLPSFPPQLSWTHYRLLLTVENQRARGFYEIETASQGWSSRELERQITSLLYERLAASRDKDEVLTLAHHGQQIASPQDVVKDPLVLEFLGLPDRPHWRERDLEQAIIDHLQEFMLELGKGFCFVARQKRITLDGDHFFVDLVLYNRLLRCFVLIDLKLGKLTHRDLGQLQMYVNWYDRTQRESHEDPTVGIALCSRKNDAVVRMTLPEGEKRILAARYEVLLPTAQELEAAVQEGRRAAERQGPGERGRTL